MRERDFLKTVLDKVLPSDILKTFPAMTCKSTLGCSVPEERALTHKDKRQYLNIEFIFISHGPRDAPLGVPDPGALQPLLLRFVRSISATCFPVGCSGVRPVSPRDF